MNVSPDYITYLEHPEKIRNLEVEVIQNWVTQYPASPIFRVMLAAKYQLDNHPMTADGIGEAAFYVQDRKVFKQLLRQWQDDNTVSPAQSTESIENQYKTDTAKLSETELAEEVSAEEEALSDSEAKGLKEFIEETIGKTESETYKDDTKTQSFSESDKSEKEDTDIPGHVAEKPEEKDSDSYEEDDVISETPVKKNIEFDEVPQAGISEHTETFIEEGITEEDDIEFLKKIGKYEAPKIETSVEETGEWILDTPGTDVHVLSHTDIVDTLLASDDISHLLPWIEEFNFPYPESTDSNQSVKETVLSAPDEDKTDSAEQDKSVVDSEKDSFVKTAQNLQHKFSFDEWLHILEQKKSNPESAPAFDLPTPEIFDFTELDSTKNIVKDLSPTKNKDVEQDINESFVRELASDSISLKKGMATETLALLYTKQGKIDLAIDAYKKLMEKNPEKSSYFADQIKKLKQ